MRRVAVLAVVVALAMVISGCNPGAASKPSGPAANVAMKYTAGQTGTYKATIESWKTAKFEGPELSKTPQLKNGRTGSTLEVVYTQEITAVNPDGSAVAKVTIKGLKYNSENSSEVVNAFDSAKDTDKPLAKLIGVSYTIKLTPDGKAAAADTKALQSAITEGSAKDIVAARFSDAELAKLHSVIALPENPKQKVGAMWSTIEASPKAMMDAKNFEKQYTLAQARDGSTVIDMKAVPSTKPLEKGEVSSQALMMATFAKMMESKDNYTGKLVMDNGAVKTYNETLDAKWEATDPEAKAGAEPDKITIGYLQKHTIDKVN
jgi:hypothetical protein